PAAEFSASCSGLNCSFDGSASSSTSAIVNYHWDFDDESSIDTPGPTVSHTYAYGAGFHVHLTITDASGATAGVTHLITVTAPPTGLTAVFGWTCNGRNCTFDGGASSGPAAIVAYHWDFGDESAADTTGPTTSH